MARQGKVNSLGLVSLNNLAGFGLQGWSVAAVPASGMI